MCTHPIDITRKHPGVGNSHVTVPCGHCEECRAFQRDQYACLCTLAAKQLGTMHFYTLTYRDSTVPVSPDGVLSLRRADVQAELKRFRAALVRKYGHTVRFKMTFFGEYGDRTHRPHYHLLTFGLNDDQANMLADSWRDHFGFVHLDSIPFLNPDGSPAFVKVALYVSKYTAKQDVIPDFIRGSLAELPRRQSSIGLGMDFSEQEFARLKVFISPKVLNLDISDTRLYYHACHFLASSAKGFLSPCLLKD